MELLATADTTDPSYWLNWRVLLCAIWVFSSIALASFLIWKYEYSEVSESNTGENRQGSACLLCDDEAWMPCIKQIPPICLMGFRIFAFLMLLGAVSADIAVHGGGLFYYYTQWTFVLVTIYFGFGSLLSIYGCCLHHKGHRGLPHQVGTDLEQRAYAPTICGETANGNRMFVNFEHQGKNYVHQSVWGHAFQVMFQMTAGAVMLTDCVYWSVIFPFLTVKDYELNIMTYIAHSLNAVMLLGEVFLNSLRFPWFRIAYFILLTSIFVIFQWIIHACVSIWWPYPFLDLSSPTAPIWYLFVALLHLPCYGIFALIVEVKEYILSRWVSHSYQLLR